MPQVINTNVMSLNAQRNLNSSQRDMQVALTRLSSGLRINSAKDDAAGMAIVTRFTAQIRGLNQAIRNANDGISLAQVAEGGLQEVTNNLQRMRELAVQAANATYGSSDRKSIQGEISSLQSEVQRIAKAVEFNGVKVLGSARSLIFQVGAYGAAGIDTVSANATDILGANEPDILNAVTTLTSAQGGATTQVWVWSANATDMQMQSAARNSLAAIDLALDRISQVRADFGTIQNRFESVVRNLTNVAENLSASRSRIEDADFAAETASLTRAQILQQAGTAMLAQANALPQNVLSLLG